MIGLQILVRLAMMNALNAWVLGRKIVLHVPIMTCGGLLIVLRIRCAILALI